MIAKNTNFTADWNNIYKIDTTSGAIIVTLPDATLFPDKAIVLLGDGKNNITITPSGTQKILGKTSYNIRAIATVVSDGANWLFYAGDPYYISPDGNAWMVSVDNSGVLSTSKVP